VGSSTTFVERFPGLSYTSVLCKSRILETAIFEPRYSDLESG
jgi:hypothetical protein